MKKLAVVIALLLICIVSFTACSAAEQYFVYGTILEVSTKGGGAKKLANSIFEYIDGLEAVFSPTVRGSDVARINAAGEGEAIVCSRQTMSLLSASLRVYEASGGAYDPSVYPLVRLWGFGGDQFSQALEHTPPESGSIQSALQLVGFDNAFAIDFENNTVTKKTGYSAAMLDFGGSAKGYAADNAAKLAGEKQSALINLGGNISVANASYRIAIRNPRESASGYFGILTLNSGEQICTGGDYERYYISEGVRYHHIINPFTGVPADSGLISVSVVSTDGALGDAASTAIMVLGLEKGKALLDALGLRGVLIAEDMSYTVVGNLDFVLS